MPDAAAGEQAAAAVPDAAAGEQAALQAARVAQEPDGRLAGLDAGPVERVAAAGVPGAQPGPDAVGVPVVQPAHWAVRLVLRDGLLAHSDGPWLTRTRGWFSRDALRGWLGALQVRLDEPLAGLDGRPVVPDELLAPWAVLRVLLLDGQVQDARQSAVRLYREPQGWPGPE